MKFESYLFLIIGPSGVGKTTLIDMILEHYSDLVFIPSYTTRNPRKNEIHGRDYFFVSNERFNEMVLKNDFLEYDRPFEGRQYGIPRKEIVDSLDKGISIIRTIAPDGLRQVIDSDISERIISILLLPGVEYHLNGVLLERDGKLDPNRSIFSIDEATVDYKLISRYGKPKEAFKDLQRIINKYILEL